MQRLPVCRVSCVIVYTFIAAPGRGIASDLHVAGITIAEPQDLLLFLLGVAGLWIGRRASRTRRNRREID
jgi:hypothetical protein